MPSPSSPQSAGPAPATDPEEGLAEFAEQMLQWLRRQDQPLTVGQIANGLGRHTNSVRTHLEELVATGLVTTRSAAADGRGRPATLYAAAPRPLPPISLVTPLAAALAATDDPERRAYAAGEAWARELQLADQPDRLEETLSRCGFQPAREGETWRLHTCPWLSAATAYPQVVCTVHHGLTQAVVGDDRAVELVPFARPGSCDLRVGEPR